MELLENLSSILKFIYFHPLNKNHQISAVFRFVRWQIRIRLVQEKVIVPWVDDSKFIVGQGETGLTGNMYAGLVEYEEMAFLLSVLRPTDTFVDIGANVGAYTILASKVVKAKTIAFEPIAATVERLNAQISLNGIERLVDVRKFGVGAENSTLSFTNNKDTVNSVSLSGDGPDFDRVSVKTLNSQVSLNNYLILKIDVEGFEFNVLEGAGTILASDKLVAIIIELNGSGSKFGHSDEEIHLKLLSYQLIPISYNPLTRLATSLKTYNLGGANTIYVKDLELIGGRCLAAPMRVVHTAHDFKI